jgi:hypothetical protein
MTTTSPSTGTTPRRRTVVLGVLAALAVLGGGLGALAASHPENAPPPGGSVAPVASVTAAGKLDSVGRIDGSTALVAVLADGDQVSAYVCDGDAATGERFSGTLLGDRAVLHSNGGAQLTVDVTDGGAAGTFTPAGTIAALPYRTIPSTGTAGWYAADAAAADGLVTANWVVLSDGTQTGVEAQHKRKHRGHKLHVRPGKPSGVSPKPGEGGGLIEGEPGVGIKEEGRCVNFPDGVCPVRELADPVELDGGPTVRPVRVLADGPTAPLSGDPQSIAGD